MKITILFFLGLIAFSQAIAQATGNLTPNILRVNIIAPGIGYELSLTERAKLAANAGLTVGGVFSDLTVVQPDIAFLIVPFFDLTYRNIYNLKRNKERGRSTMNNAGHYFGTRLMVRGNNFNEEVIRTSRSDFSFGPIWGVQGYIGRYNFDFNLGPIYYLDTKGNGGFSASLGFTIGYNLLTH